MYSLLSRRVLAIEESYLRALRMAHDKITPNLSGSNTEGIWAGISYAHPDIWAARGTPKASGDVAVIPVLGALTERASWMGMSYDGIRASLRSAVADSGIKAIVFEFDSPGGEVLGCDELAAEIYDARRQKPVVAVAKSVAFSAAYYLASQAEQIIVPPSGAVGSIGVFGGHMDFSEALTQMGVKVTLISAGEGKTDGNPWEPLSTEAKEDMQKDVDHYYRMFVSAVSKGRRHAGVTADKVRSEWKAKTYNAKDSVAMGLADAIGTDGDAIRKAASLVTDRRALAASVETEAEVRQRLRQRTA